MSEKIIDQNDIFNHEIIESLDCGFEFKENPINRILNLNDLTEDKNKYLKKLFQSINSIEDCSLKNNSKNLILGDGNIDSQLMLIGEAPNDKDDKDGKPFSGEVGDLLDKMLNAINIKKDNVYFSYAVNFRPPEDRKPTSTEIKKYSNFLINHISIIQPKIIVLMGSTAMESLTGLKTKISDERGKWKDLIIKNKLYPTLITFNPSYLIRFPENKKFSWNDLKNLKKKIIEMNLKI